MFPWVSACGHTIISLKWAYEQVNDSRISPDCRSSPSVGALYYCMHLHFTSDCRQSTASLARSRPSQDQLMIIVMTRVP